MSGPILPNVTVEICDKEVKWRVLVDGDVVKRFRFYSEAMAYKEGRLDEAKAAWERSDKILKKYGV